MENISEIKEFNKLFSNYQGIFIRFANTYIQDEDTAEDIVVDSLVYYWENRHSLSSNSNIPAYIMEVVKHKSLNYLRNQRIREDIEQNLWTHMDRVRRLKITTLEACDPEELFSSEAQRLINETLESLPEKTRTIFIMSRYENKSHKEIAEHLDLSTKSIEFHITKALSVLRKRLKDYLPFFLIFLN
ncbi:RNA polymerase sigma-70 factor [Parabacteroides goldsteinii]|uniref:RNA polymerase sigma-70 factor n=1 Tax=Parabacteroides goldsteinii TaxID=328812 RepID=UPI00256EE239|nr:RNA polymerase sigma-70 factor [Parabacteroides goldsteinii]